MNQSMIESGYVAVSKKPGLGVEVDERVLEEHKAEGREFFNPDEPVWVVRNTWKNS